MDWHERRCAEPKEARGDSGMATTAGTEVGFRKSDAVQSSIVSSNVNVRGCSARRAGATDSCRADGARSFAQRICTEPGSVPTRDRIPAAIAGQLVLCERGDEGSASEVLGQPVKILR